MSLAWGLPARGAVRRPEPAIMKRAASWGRATTSVREPGGLTMPNIPSPREFPFSLQDVRNEFDRLLDRVWHKGLCTAPLDGQDWAPSLDVIEEADAYRVRVEIPGMVAEDVEVSILDNTLTIKGVKPPPVKADEEAPRRLRTECCYGGFCRRYELPGPVQEDGVTAACKHGVLDVTIPKTPEIIGRKVQVSPRD